MQFKNIPLSDGLFPEEKVLKLYKVRIKIEPNRESQRQPQKGQRICFYVATRKISEAVDYLHKTKPGCVITLARYQGSLWVIP